MNSSLQTETSRLGSMLPPQNISLCGPTTVTRCLAENELIVFKAREKQHTNTNKPKDMNQSSHSVPAWRASVGILVQEQQPDQTAARDSGLSRFDPEPNLGETDLPGDK